MPARMKPFVVLTVVAALCVLGAWWWTTRDERAINRRLDRLAALVAKSSDEKEIAVMLRAKEISGFFDRAAVLKLGSPLREVGSRDDLLLMIHHVRSSVKSLKVIVRDRTLSVDPSRRAASMNVVAEAVVVYRDEPDHDVREFALEWIKKDGAWIISKAEVTETILRPPGVGAQD